MYRKYSESDEVNTVDGYDIYSLLFTIYTGEIWSERCIGRHV